jgi:hypothetical protein
MDTIPVLSTHPNRTTRNRREAFNDSESEEDEEYRPRIRPRRVTGRVAPTTPVVLYAEHQKIKELLTAYAPIKRWKRYTEATSYQRQPVYETVQMIELSNLQEIEVDELITKFYIEIKNSLTYVKVRLPFITSTLGKNSLYFTTDYKMTFQDSKTF